MNTSSLIFRFQPNTLNILLGIPCFVDLAIFEIRQSFQIVFFGYLEMSLQLQLAYIRQVHDL